MQCILSLMSNNNSIIVSTNLFLSSKLVDALVAFNAAGEALRLADLRLARVGRLADLIPAREAMLAAEVAYGEAADSVGALEDALSEAPELVAMAHKAVPAVRA